MEITIKERAEAGISYESVLNLLHSSFMERLNAGLHYSVSSFSIEDLIDKTRNGIILVALDEKANLIGTACIKIIKKGTESSVILNTVQSRMDTSIAE